MFPFDTFGYSLTSFSEMVVRVNELDLSVQLKKEQSGVKGQM